MNEAMQKLIDTVQKASPVICDTVGKISVQEKIAELESRIAALEKGVRVHSRITETFSSHVPSSEMWRHWHKMWDEFNLAMKDAFKWHA